MPISDKNLCSASFVSNLTDMSSPERYGKIRGVSPKTHACQSNLFSQIYRRLGRNRCLFRLLNNTAWSWFRVIVFMALLYRSFMDCQG